VGVYRVGKFCGVHKVLSTLTIVAMAMKIEILE